MFFYNVSLKASIFPQIFINKFLKDDTILHYFKLNQELLMMLLKFVDTQLKSEVLQTK